MRFKEKITKKKRLKLEISYDLKKQICQTYIEKINENKNYTQSMLIDHFEEIIGQRIASSTLSDELINELVYVKIVYFTPNCTSHLQPADVGTIKPFKSHYANQ